TWEEHERHLGLILELLKKEKMYAKFSKCAFWFQEVQFLRHMINDDGIHVDPSKIEGHGNQGNRVRGRALGAKEARQDLNIMTVLGEMPVAKSPCRLAPFELEELSRQLKELQDKEVQFLGHMINDDGIHVDPSKIEKSKTFDWGEEQECSFQTLKDRFCNAPVLALPDGPEDFVVYCDTSGLELGCVLMQRVQETIEKISHIKDRIKVVQDRQKSYVNKRRKPIEFSVGDCVLLKVSPWKGVVRFRKKWKLVPRFVGPFEIIEKDLDGVHDMFHVSNLKKCLDDPTLQVPLDKIQVDDKLNFVEEPVEIIEREFKKLKRSRIAIVK
nr:putative reverse transcriptase domain-containing protein [Tanacetum cinerariifolium]